jgi:hypothetical protein
MNFAQRFSYLLFQPDYATSDVYDSPPLAQAFVMVVAYASLSSFHSMLSIALATGSVSFSLAAFMGSFILVVLTWVGLTFLFQIALEFFGGLGELPNTAAFVGLAAAPNIVISAVAILVTIAGAGLMSDDTDALFGKIKLLLALVAMAWGWPGVLCYFGLKNGGRLHMVKAMVVTAIVFLVFVLIEILNSNVL